MTPETTQALLSQRWQLLKMIADKPVLALVLEAEVRHIDALLEGKVERQP